MRSPDTLGTRRTRAHSELLVTELELGVLWEEYGLVGDVVVSISLPIFCHLVVCRVFMILTTS